MDFILASASPRRKSILEKFTNFRVEVSKISEDKQFYKSSQSLVMGLAFEKAYSIAKEREDALVIGADTLVDLEGRVLGKPKNMDDAEKMIRAMSGKKHSVYTGLALVNLKLNKKIISFEKTDVIFKTLSEREIANYMRNADYMDKAGAYGIQEEAGLFVEKIVGDYFNVMGLPICLLNKLLIRHFDINLLEEV